MYSQYFDRITLLCTCQVLCSTVYTLKRQQLLIAPEKFITHENKVMIMRTGLFTVCGICSGWKISEPIPVLPLTDRPSLAYCK